MKALTTSLAAVLLAALVIAMPADAAPPRALYSADGTTDGPGSIGLFSVAVPGGLPSMLEPPVVETGGDPQHLAVTTDGRRAYASAAGPGIVRSYRVRPRNGSLAPLAGEPAAAGTGAHGVVVTPAGGSVYVASQDTGSVFQYDVGADGTLAAKAPPSVEAGAGASGVAVAPDGGAVYVTNLNAGTVGQYLVDPGSGALEPMDPPTVAAPPLPGGIGVSPDGRSLYVATLSGYLAQYRISARSRRLRPMSPATLPVGTGAAGIATTPDGRFLYPPDGGTDSASQFAVDRETGELTPLEPASVPAGDRPEGAAITPDGRALYVANAGSATVSWFAIDRRTGLLTPRGPVAVQTGPEPHGLVVTPDQGPRARFRVRKVDRAVRVGERVRFDASGSRDPDGTIARYAWRFGDGEALRRGPADPVHRYEEPRRYTVRLRVTDDERCSARFIYTGQTASCDGGPDAIAKRRVKVRPAR